MPYIIEITAIPTWLSHFHPIRDVGSLDNPSSGILQPGSTMECFTADPQPVEGRQST